MYSAFVTFSVLVLRTNVTFLSTYIGNDSWATLWISYRRTLSSFAHRFTLMNVSCCSQVELLLRLSKFIINCMSKFMASVFNYWESSIISKHQSLEEDVQSVSQPQTTKEERRLIHMRRNKKKQTKQLDAANYASKMVAVACYQLTWPSIRLYSMNT